MTFSVRSFAHRLPIDGTRPLLFACLLAGACSTSGEDPPGGAGADAGDDSSAGGVIDVAVFDMVANDTTLFARMDNTVVAISPESEELTTLWEVPALVKEDDSHIALESVSLLFADAEYVLVRRSAQFFSAEGQPVFTSSPNNELWQVPTASGEATMVASSYDTRDFRGASIHEDQIFTNSAYTVYSMQLTTGEFVSSFGTADDGNWVSNPIVDRSDRLWFTRNSELYSVGSASGGDSHLEPTLSVPGSFAQEAQLFPSDAGDDLLVWAPGAGIYQVALGADDPPTALGFKAYIGSEFFLRAARVGDSLWICEFDSIVEVSLATETRQVHEMEGGACSIASIGNEVFIGDGVSIERVAVDPSRNTRR